MKALLYASLAANIVLLAVLGVSSRDSANDRTAKAAVPVPNVPEGAEAAASIPPIVPVTSPVDWRQVESEDYRKYAANLRAIGCPEETIRDIITADVNKLFAQRRKNLTKAGDRFEFWKTGNPMAGMMSEERVAEQQQLAREKREMLSSLIGSEVEAATEVTDMSGVIDEMLDFLPSSKRAQALEIEQRFAARQMKSMSGGAPDAEDMKEMRNVQKEKDAEMAKLLSPAEKEDYDLRMSQTAMMMRFQLDGFEPSEQEFRDIFAIKRKYEDSLNPFWNPAGNAEEMKKRTAAQNEQNGELRALLGDERFAEYEREQDFTYKPIAKIARRQELPETAAVDVFHLKKDVETRAAALRSGSDPSQSQQSLKDLRAETEKKIMNILGQEGLQSLLDNPAASHWFTNLPSAQAPPKK